MYCNFNSHLKYKLISRNQTSRIFIVFLNFSFILVLNPPYFHFPTLLNQILLTLPFVFSIFKWQQASMYMHIHPCRLTHLYYCRILATVSLFIYSKRSFSTHFLVFFYNSKSVVLWHSFNSFFLNVCKIVFDMNLPYFQSFPY